MSTAPPEDEQGRDPRSRSDALLDALVYAPLGALANALEDLPALARKGRSLADSRLASALLVGRFAAGEVERRARRFVEDLTAAPASSKGRADAPTTGPAPRPEPQAADAPDPADLAIPGYDSLSASQVVQRLPGLSPDELAAVERYESATRRRQTVLNRVAQLQLSDQ